MLIGITGGEEDGVDNTGVDNAALYTQPEDIWEVHEALSQVASGLVNSLSLSWLSVPRKVSPNFSIAAAFGNVHGVYKPGNVKLQPTLLGKHQAHVKEKLGGSKDKPL